MLSEDIRLVIWDLDETFWSGTLAEGGVRVSSEHIEIVKALAARGVMSSICSKNDLAAVRRLLHEHGVWELFVFPDISWEPKGDRLKALLHQVQLRPASALFIDDNPSNRAEALRFAPGLNVADEGVIPHLLRHPRLVGKPDRDLVRLQHYKQLERRRAATLERGDMVAFLRESHISVEFCFDLDPHLPRIVELINRTNQLNFIKARISEDPATARTQLSVYFEQFNFQCGLVQVRDAYGDHGYCGFYIYNSDFRRLEQFCFSCRILGMGVEQWVYAKLGRPEIGIVGEVLSDLNQPWAVDWINQSPTEAVGQHPALAQAVTARGGCELAAVVHYFIAASPDAAGEYYEIRNGLRIRLEHTAILHQGLQGLTADQQAAAVRLGFLEEDFRSRIFDSFAGGHAVILSFAVDAGATLLRHIPSGFIAPLFLPDVRWSGMHAELSSEAHPATRASVQRALDLVGRDYEQLGPIDEVRFRRHVSALLDQIPPSTEVFILCIHEASIVVDGVRVPSPVRAVLINRWTRLAAQGRRNVHLLRMEDYADEGDAFENHFHFRRTTYFRIFQSLQAALAAQDYARFDTRSRLGVVLRSAWVALRSSRAMAPARTLARHLRG